MARAGLEATKGAEQSEVVVTQGRPRISGGAVTAAPGERSLDVDRAFLGTEGLTFDQFPVVHPAILWPSGSPWPPRPPSLWTAARRGRAPVPGRPRQGPGRRPPSTRRRGSPPARNHQWAGEGCPGL